MAEGCQDFSHLEWHQSFGWGEPNAELSERELMLGLAEERRRIMKERIEQARSRLLAISKFTFQLMPCLLVRILCMIVHL